jgi:NAD+ synthase (glutamine-hydrolysing)
MFERMRKIHYNKDPKSIGDKVKHFFKFYAINRHKQTTTTPSFHYQSSSCDDNRFDMRPYLYNA